MPRTRTARRCYTGLAGLAILVLACDRGRDVTMLPDDFIEVIVDLRLAERRAEAADSPAVEFGELRDEILAGHGVTEADLRRFVAAHSSDLRRMERIWERIERQLRRVDADTASTPPPARDSLEPLPGRRPEAPDTARTGLVPLRPT